MLLTPLSARRSFAFPHYNEVGLEAMFRSREAGILWYHTQQFEEQLRAEGGRITILCRAASFQWSAQRVANGTGRSCEAHIILCVLLCAIVSLIRFVEMVKKS